MAARRGTWRAIGESVIGVTHARDGRVCQDAFRSHVSTPGVVVVAVADGHGQAKSFRSRDGAIIAVEDCLGAEKTHELSIPRLC